MKKHPRKILTRQFNDFAGFASISREVENVCIPFDYVVFTGGYFFSRTYKKLIIRLKLH